MTSAVLWIWRFLVLIKCTYSLSLFISYLVVLCPWICSCSTLCISYSFITQRCPISFPDACWKISRMSLLSYIFPLEQDLYLDLPLNFPRESGKCIIRKSYLVWFWNAFFPWRLLGNSLKYIYKFLAMKYA